MIKLKDVIAEDEKNKKELYENIGKVLAGILVNPWIFQFVLWRFVHRDIPWYMDIWAGMFFTNKYFIHILSVLWIGTLVASYCGVEYPFFYIP